MGLVICMAGYSMHTFSSPLLNSKCTHKNCRPSYSFQHCSKYFASITQKVFLQPRLLKCGKTSLLVKGAASNEFLSMEDRGDEVCELVNGIDLALGEREDNFDAHLLQAVKNNTGSAVLLLADEFGYKDPGTRDFAYRLSCNGYNVLVPDLFRGEPLKKDTSQSDYEEWINKQTPQRVAKDIDTCTKWLIDQLDAAGIAKKLGLVGFSIGGNQLIETLARDTQGHYGAAVCFYATKLDAKLVSKLRIPVLFIVGQTDPSTPEDVLNYIEKQLKGSQLRSYASKGHGFVHRPESSEEDTDADDAFFLMKNWLSDNLLGNTNDISQIGEAVTCGC